MYVSDTLSTGNNIEEMHAYYFVVILFYKLILFYKENWLLQFKQYWIWFVVIQQINATSFFKLTHDCKNVVFAWIKVTLNHLLSKVIWILKFN